MKQLSHHNTNFTKRTFPVTLVCDNVTNAPNIGSLFRIADAFGVEKLIFCGQDISLGRRMTKTSRSTENSVDFEVKEDVIEVCKELRIQGHAIISLEITDTSKPIHTFTFPKERPMAIFVGDENSGVSEEVLKLSDDIILINMFGQNSSMNVVQATNICLYEIVKQLL
ncbi:MAG: TrmH family RNA methyltransferase [Flavobacteriaceae bacterium]|nr:MAG: TrmH family RNA methyltransferase [Flavobacteriaceae bacterium]